MEWKFRCMKHKDNVMSKVSHLIEYEGKTVSQNSYAAVSKHESCGTKLFAFISAAVFNDLKSKGIRVEKQVKKAKKAKK